LPSQDRTFADAYPEPRDGDSQPREAQPIGVVCYAPEIQPPHDGACHRGFAKQIASLMNVPFRGEFDPARTYGGRVFFVPSETLSYQEAEGLGIHSERDLFGGVVPAAFVATKAIAHPLIAPDAHAPETWNCDLASDLDGIVHAGFAAFAMADAHAAGLRLLTHGAARIKPTWESGSRGQCVFRDPHELEAALARIDEARMRACGVVLEQNLEKVRTYSAGEARVAGSGIAYWGTQNETLNNDGETVYGGSDLIFIRGQLQDLLRRTLDGGLRVAIEQACAFDIAVRLRFPSMFASRRNYDIAQGLDAQSRWRSGLLEQSWRIGGATGAELCAISAFRNDESLGMVRASTVELYGEAAEPPVFAKVHFRGTDPDVGPITKYTVVHERK
jgi:hypothetical protein